MCRRWSRIRKKQLSLVFKKTFRVFVSTKIGFTTLLENIWIIIKTSKVIENRTEESQEKVDRKHNRKPTCVFKAKIYTFNVLFEIAHKRLAELEDKGMIQTMISTQYIVSKVFPDMLQQRVWYRRFTKDIECKMVNYSNNNSEKFRVFVSIPINRGSWQWVLYTTTKLNQILHDRW